MSRVERLVNLLAALIETDRPLTRADIQERVPGYSGDAAAARRAFERDKEVLRRMGLPLTLEPLDAESPDHGEGYRIPRDKYQLRDPGLTREETQALAVAASAVKLKSQAAAAALWKLGGDPTAATPANVALTDHDELAVVFAARSNRQTLTFTHKDRTRTLDPYRLSFRNGHWYVNGFDHDHADVRTYRFDRIEGGIQPSAPNAFAPPTGPAQAWLPPWQMGEEPPVQAQVLFDAEQAEIAIDQVGRNAVVEPPHDDGSVTLTFQVTNRDAFRSFVLGFLHHAEVLEPPALRDEMRAYLQHLSGAQR